MQEIDHAIKIVLTRKPNSVLDLTFGSHRTIKLRGIADSQINIPEFTPFLSLFRQRPRPAIIKVQKNLLAQITDPELRTDLTAATILVDLRAFGAEMVLSNFTPKELNMLKETSFVQEWLTESLREGKREGKLSVLEFILAQKFGALSTRLRSQLQKLDDKKLDRLTLKLENIHSQKDLQAWLRNGASRNHGK